MIRIIAQRHNVPFLCDASQAVGKIPIQFNPWGITLLALSAHKLYGPQGVGALVVRRGHRLAPLTPSPTATLLHQAVQAIHSLTTGVP